MQHVETRNERRAAPRHDKLSPLMWRPMPAYPYAAVTAEPSALDTARATVALFQQVVDQVDHGLAVVSAGGRLVMHNRAAERDCDRSGILRIHASQLMAPHLQHREQIARASAAAQRGQRTLLRLRHGDKRLALATLPLAAPANSALRSPMLVVFGKHIQCEPLTLELFAAQCELTRAESGVLRGVSEGLSPREIADRAGVALSTIRSHIGNIRIKTGAGSIEALQRMLGALPPVVGATEIR